MTKLDEKMIPVYADLIRKGEKTLDDVPAHLRDAVQVLLDNSERED